MVGYKKFGSFYRCGRKMDSSLQKILGEGVYMLYLRDDRDVHFLGPMPPWAQDGVMAAVPYVDNKKMHLIGRAYTQSADQSVYRSCIFHADAEDPYSFLMRPDPLLAPGDGGEEGTLACEDPTIVRSSSEDYLLYSRVRGKPFGMEVHVSLELLSLRNRTRQVVLEPTEQRWWKRPIDMCKEAEVLLQPHEKFDPLFYEFADGQCSRIAVARSNFCGRRRFSTARESRLWLEPRPGKWDSDHVSTGPIVDFGNKKLMFYNGCSNKRWSIGEVVFYPSTLEIDYRSEEPLIVPPQEVGWQGQCIAFSSGAFVDPQGLVYLYYHVADKRIKCATGTFE